MEGKNDELICPICRSTSIAHFNLEFQNSTHRTMCHDCKEWADGMSFEESDVYFKRQNNNEERLNVYITN